MMLRTLLRLGIPAHSAGDSRMRQWGLATAPLRTNGTGDPVEVKKPHPRPSPLQLPRGGEKGEGSG